MVLAVDTTSDLARDRLKPVHEVIDTEALLPPVLMELLAWAAGYYHHPIGEVMQSALPVLLRRGLPATSAGEKRYALTASALVVAPDAFKRSLLQQRLFEAMCAHPEGMNAAALTGIASNWREPMKRLEARGTKATYPLVAQIQGAVYELRTQVDGYGFFRLFYYQNGPTSFCVFDKYQKGSKRLPGRVKKRVLTRYTDLTGKKA